MAKGKFKGKPTGERSFSSEEQIAAGTSAGRPKTFKKKQDEKDVYDRSQESDEEASNNFQKNKHKGTEGLIEIENPNLVKPKNIKAKDIDIGRTTALSRREREELEKQKSHERYMKLQEQGKTEKARKDLERLALIRQERAEAAKRREEEKAAKEKRKGGASK
ncbi:28 kDa heat- and acid-stable phosphoprotein-like [Oryza brachyantha]|uniref:28 kDa heat- and acid-stable phosphoprotein-like n=1 Tax=Oryza brachyantha TaxID=4533 RepID=UPI000776AC30|nr:28 kDa heat- and acid-stable phosphoprotein-like [Oryza brachyantha]